MSSEKQRKYYAGAPKRATGTLLNLRQIEQRFGADEYWVYRWVAEGRLRAVLVGRRFYYPEWEVRELAKSIPPDEPPFADEKSSYPTHTGVRAA